MKANEIAIQNTVMDSMACAMDCRGRLKVAVVYSMMALNDLEKSLQYSRNANIAMGQLKLFKKG